MEPLDQTIEYALDDIEASLERLIQWGDAYPVDIFPEPDQDYYRRAQEVLAANGMSVDRLSAAAMRHVATRTSEIARRAMVRVETLREAVLG